MLEPVTILLVEDEPADVRLTELELDVTELRNELHVVPDGEQALDFLHRRGAYADAPRPDLVLLDLHLPRVSGEEVLAEIRATASLRSLPVVVLTVMSAHRGSDDLRRSGADAVVTKPLRLEDLLRVVAEIDDLGLSIVQDPEPPAAPA